MLPLICFLFSISVFLTLAPEWAIIASECTVGLSHLIAGEGINQMQNNHIFKKHSMSFSNFSFARNRLQCSLGIWRKLWCTDKTVDLSDSLLTGSFRCVAVLIYSSGTKFESSNTFRDQQYPPGISLCGSKLILSDI